MQTIHLSQQDASRLGVYTPKLAELDTFCQGMVDQKLHPYVAFRVWHKGEEVFRGDYGTQSPGGGALRTDAIFPIASVTKPFVATCAAILQEQGKINFFDRVQDRFPEFTGEGKDGVLLWHLLSHCSGINDDVNEGILHEQWSTLKTTAEKAGLDDAAIQKLDEAFRSDYEVKMLKLPLSTMPGTQYSYCGFGYHLIKLLLERITGDTLEAFAKKYIFDPLGMNDTFWFVPEEKRSRLATCDPSFKGGGWMNDGDVFTNTGAGGGLKSTLDDMAKFGRMYLNMGTLDGVRVISPATVRLVTRDHTSNLPKSGWLGRTLGANWGLGWDVKSTKIDDLGMLHSPSSYNHGGFGGARLLVDPDCDLVVSIYIREQREDSFYDNMNYAVDILYSALN